jgi:hypothetical protein
MNDVWSILLLLGIVLGVIGVFVVVDLVVYAVHSYRAHRKLWHSHSQIEVAYIRFRDPHRKTLYVPEGTLVDMEGDNDLINLLESWNTCPNVKPMLTSTGSTLYIDRLNGYYAGIESYSEYQVLKLAV